MPFSIGFPLLAFLVVFAFWFAFVKRPRDVPPHVKRLDDYRNPWGDE